MSALNQCIANQVMVFNATIRRSMISRFLASLILLAIFSNCSHVRQRKLSSEEDSLRVSLTNTRNYILSQRKENRYWSGVFSSDVTSDAIVLALGKKIGKLTPELQESYLQSMEVRMTADRQGWPSYPDGPVDKNVTAVALTCLKYLGLEEDPRFKLAFEWFNQNGGEKKMPFFSVQMLAPLELGPYHKIPSISPKIFGLSRLHPLQVDNIGFPRAFTVPFITLSYIKKQGDQKWANRKKTVEEWMALPIEIGNSLKFRRKKFWAEQGLAWTLQSQNQNNGWCATIATLLGIRLLQEAERVGLGSFQAQIDQAWSGLLKTRALNQDGHWVQQPMAPGIWDTASVLLGFEKLRGTEWELPKEETQQTLRWLTDHAANVPKGKAWGFDETDKSNPDVDDTAHVIHALLNYLESGDKVTESTIWEGLAWVDEHRNKDGGFPAWTREASKLMVRLMHMTDKVPPFEDFSQADITARVLYLFADARARFPEQAERVEEPIREACTFLATRQPKLTGTTLRLAPGFWMINYLYTGANVLTGMAAAGCHPQIQEEIARWMVSAQQEDGGWGESKSGYVHSSYVPDSPLLSQTAVVLTGLVLYYEELLKKQMTSGVSSGELSWLDDSIQRGIQYLIRKTDRGQRFVEKEFTGVLIKGVIYGRYELLPAYTSFFVLSRWKQLEALREAALVGPPEPKQMQ